MAGSLTLGSDNGLQLLLPLLIGISIGGAGDLFGFVDGSLFNLRPGAVHDVIRWTGPAVAVRGGTAVGFPFLRGSRSRSKVQGLCKVKV